MNKAQTDPVSEAPLAPQEERAARHLRLLARMAEIQMEVAEAARTEAVEAPQPGVDYCRRVAVIARSLRLTLLLEEKMGETRREQRRPAEVRPAEATEPDRAHRVFLAVAAAIDETAENEAEDARLCREVQEYLERPEVAERVEACPAPEMVAELCRRYGLPADTEEWLAVADAALEEMGFEPPDEAAAPARPVDPGRTRRRLRVIMALGAAIRAGAEDEAETDRRFFAMAEEMDRPDLLEIADGVPAAEAVARLCPIFGLPPEEAQRWVAEADEDLAEMNLPPVEDNRQEPADTG